MRFFTQIVLMRTVGAPLVGARNGRATVGRHKACPYVRDDRRRMGLSFCYTPLRVFLSCISLMAVLITCPTVNAAITAPSYTAVFVADPTRPIPTQEFDCSQNIYAYFTWWGLKDLHQITVLWINPKGKQQDEIDLKFVASAEKIENWVGLKFFNLRKERNPLIHDSSSADFVGTWTARIFLDGNLLEEKKFAVTCD